MRFHSGLTLIELVIAIAVAGLLVALAAPSFSNLQARRAADAAIAALTSDLALARSEAIKRGNSVTVCSSADGNNCLGVTEWRQGWIVYHNAIIPGNPARAASEVLRAQGLVSGIDSMQATRQAMTFRQNGVGSGIAGNVRVTPLADPAQVRLMCISILGRVSVLPAGANAC